MEEWQNYGHVSALVNKSHW